MNLFTPWLSPALTKQILPAMCMGVTCLINVYYHAVHCLNLTNRGRSFRAS